MTDFYRTAVRVHWADTDAAGIVWFGNFLRYFEEAEDELFRALGQTRLALRRQYGILMPRVEAACRYRSPARAEETLSIGIAIKDMTSRRVTYQFEARALDDDRIVCQGEYRVACVDADTMKPCDFPAGVRALLGRTPALIAGQRTAGRPLNKGGPRGCGGTSGRPRPRRPA